MLINRLAELRQMKNIKKKDVAEYLSVAPSTYGKYELGHRTPSPETLIKLAHFYNVSTDYLLGKTNHVHRISDLRNKYGHSQQELADLISVDVSDVESWENNISMPTVGDVGKLCRLFNVSHDYLMGISETINTPNQTRATRIPVLGVIPAGIPMEAIEDILDYEDIPSNWTNCDAEYFGLKITGNSMCPEYRDGDIIIFKKQTTCENNEDCAVMVNGDDATFKRVERQKGGIILKPLNPSFDTVFYSNEEIENLPIEIIGVFWELRRGRKG